MSNTSLGKGKKGSKFWMGTVLEYPELEKDINALIGQDVSWISPLPKENYREYEIKQKGELLGLKPDEIQKLFSFWPSRQPQWDGIAVGNNNQTLFLIEAKAHLKELNSKCMSKNPSSKDKIRCAMKTVHATYYKKADFGLWMEEYYQLANRLTFYHMIKDMIKRQEIKAFDDIKLVLLNFANDFTYNSTDIVTWRDYMSFVFEKMTGFKDTPEGVLELFIDVGKYSDAFKKTDEGKWILK
ncbi:hypothetical protein [Butyrivibrio hungatei]|nr:hypothetical protein [Butyrivibrio hungatei]